MKELKNTLKAINEQFGEGTVLGLDLSEKRPPGISTGNLELDFLTNRMGIPKGKIVEIYGNESSGKTTIALQHAAEVQKAGGVVAFIDMEHALDPHWAATLGVDLSKDKFIFIQPEVLETSFEIYEKLIPACDLIIYDSIAGASDIAELEGNITDHNIGTKARIIGKGVRRVTSKLNANNCTGIFINQTRVAIGNPFAGPNTPGGKALKFHASLRIELKSKGKLKDSRTNEFFGNEVEAKIVKTKLGGSPHSKATLNMIYGEGFTNAYPVFHLGLKYGLLEKYGSGCKFEGQSLGRGEHSSAKALIDNPELLEGLASSLKMILGEELNLLQG